MIVQLDSENADRDIKTAAITVLTHTPDASNPMICQGLIFLGDGAKNLDGTGGAFQLIITVGGQTIEPSPQTVTFSTAVRAAVWTTPFPVPANKEVVIKVLSPNVADSDVDVTAYLYDISAQGALVLNNLDHIADSNGKVVVVTNDDKTGYSLTRPTGAVATYVGNSTTVFKTTLTEATNDFWIGSYLKITSGALLGQVRKVLDYDGTDKIITVAAAFTGIPADDVTFVLVNE